MDLRQIYSVSEGSSHLFWPVGKTSKNILLRLRQEFYFSSHSNPPIACSNGTFKNKNSTQFTEITKYLFFDNLYICIESESHLNAMSSFPLPSQLFSFHLDISIFTTTCISTCICIIWRLNEFVSCFAIPRDAGNT